MGILRQLEAILLDLSQKIPVEAFTGIGAFLEEVIAPIPSPLVMATAGSLTAAQGKTAVFLLWLSLIGTIGKTLGAWIIYILAVKFKAVVVSRFGKYLGVSQQDVDDLQKHFRGGARDLLILFILRLLPVVPTSPVSLISGLIPLKLWVYLAGTFIGTFFRGLFYLYVGYSGVAAYEGILHGLDRTESLVQIALFLILAAGVGFFYYQRRRGQGLGWLNKKNK